MAVLDVFKVEPQMYDQATRSIKNDREKGKELGVKAGKIEQEERLRLKGEGYEILSKEKALEYIKAIEI